MSVYRVANLEERGLFGGVASGLDGILGGNSGSGGSATTSSDSDPLGIVTGILSPIIGGGPTTTSSSSTTQQTTTSTSTHSSSSSSSSSSTSSEQTATSSATTSSSTSTSSATFTSTSTSSDHTSTPTPTSTSHTTAATTASSATSASVSSSSSDTSSTSSTGGDSPSPSSSSSESASLPSTTSFSFSSSASSSSVSASAAALPASASTKGFLENKALSVGVITACTLVGLVLFVVITTCVVRKRQRNKLHEEAVDFSPFPSADGLGGTGGALTTTTSISSIEKGEVPRKSTSSRSVNGVERSASNGSARSAKDEMYERSGYGAVPAFAQAQAPAPPPKAYPAKAYPTAMQGYNDVGQYQSYDYRANAGYPQNQSAYQQAAYGYPQAQGAYQAGYAQNQAGYPQAGYPQNQGGYQQPAQMVTSTPTGAYGAGATRQPSQSKQAAPLPSNVQMEQSPPAYPGGAQMPAGSSKQPANSSNPASPKRSSLLDSPAKLAYTASDIAQDSQTGRPRSHSRLLDPSMPELPKMAPLPEQFGDEKAALRQLTIRNE